MTVFSDIPTLVDMILSKAEGRLALLLDFDGTLVKIASSPGAIDVTTKVHDVLGALDRGPHFVSLISGRGIEDLRQFLPDFNGPISGGHGAEFWDGARRIATSGIDDAAVEAAFADAQHFAADHLGVEIEKKATGVVIHFRNAPSAETASESLISDIVAAYPGFEVHHSKAAVEACPKGVSKGTAVHNLLKALESVTPIAIGDDATDEDMFRAVQVAGGFAIKVGPEETRAEHRLVDPDEVLEFLTQLNLKL